MGIKTIEFKAFADQKPGTYVINTKLPRHPAISQCPSLAGC